LAGAGSRFFRGGGADERGTPACRLPPVASSFHSPSLSLVPLRRRSLARARRADAGRFFTFLALLGASSLCVSSLFRLIAIAVPTPPLVNAVAGILLLLLILTSGFTIGGRAGAGGWLRAGGAVGGPSSPRPGEACGVRSVVSTQNTWGVRLLR
jgi:hypothetical protein